MSGDMLRGLACRSGRGVVSVCSAHPLVIEAALLQALEDGSGALIEATCNQVNQDGGYTGMTPAGFRDLVHALADGVGLAREQVVLGGDHLGPNPWKQLAAEEALAKAGDMVGAYARAGYGKLHLDASMGCAGEASVLGDELIATRAASLAARAEQAAIIAPVYVIGTEVPTPGGATETLAAIEPTQPGAVLTTWAVHRERFEATGAWDRVIAMVVQPGVDFGHDAVAVYRPERARALSAALAEMPGLVFEAHSTDYQPEAALRRLVADGFAILKVGPALTFALREALYGLDAIRGVLRPGAASLPAAMDRVMTASPRHWRSHYHGSEAETRVLRHFSYSDRVRYYWPEPEAMQATSSLVSELEERPIPETLVSQFLPRLHDRFVDGAIGRRPKQLLIEAVRDVLRMYARAASTAREIEA